MKTNPEAQAHTMTDAAVQATCPMVPVGCISAIPRQSVDSCYLVIQTLADELSWMTLMLSEALVAASDGDDSDERKAERQEGIGCRAVNSATSLLEDLRRDWPHLDPFDK